MKITLVTQQERDKMLEQEAQQPKPYEFNKDKLNEVKDSDIIIWEKIGDSVAGILLNVEEEQGKFKDPNKKYTVEVGPGIRKVFWGTKILNDKMTVVKIGEFVYVEYVGDKESKTGSTYKTFKVDHGNATEVIKNGGLVDAGDIML